MKVHVDRIVSFDRPVFLTFNDRLKSVSALFFYLLIVDVNISSVILLCFSSLSVEINNWRWEKTTNKRFVRRVLKFIQGKRSNFSLFFFVKMIDSMAANKLLLEWKLEAEQRYDVHFDDANNFSRRAKISSKFIWLAAKIGLIEISVRFLSIDQKLSWKCQIDFGWTLFIGSVDLRKGKTLSDDQGFIDRVDSSSIDKILNEQISRSIRRQRLERSFRSTDFTIISVLRMTQRFINDFLLDRTSFIVFSSSSEHSRIMKLHRWTTLQSTRMNIDNESTSPMVSFCSLYFLFFSRLN